MSDVSLNLVAGAAAAPTRNRRVAAPVRSAPADRRRPVRARAAPSVAAPPRLPPAGLQVLACEGPHVVGLSLPPGGGWRYEWHRYQSITGKWMLRAADARRDAVLSALWAAECRHSEPLGASGPRLSGAGFGVNLHALLCGPEYPADVSGLSAAQAAVLPDALEWQSP